MGTQYTVLRKTASEKGEHLLEKIKYTDFHCLFVDEGTLGYPCTTYFCEYRTLPKSQQGQELLHFIVKVLRIAIVL